jgi:ankyrin repeat protein
MTSPYNRNDGLPDQVGYLRRPEQTYSDEMVYYGGAPANDLWAMIAAATSGDVESIQALADKNPALATANLNYDQPLHFAVRGSHVEAVRVLLERGANILAESRLNGINQTLNMALDRGNQEIYDLLDEDRRKKFAYHPKAKAVSQALRQRSVEAVRTMLDAETSLAHASDETGNQPMHWASMTGQMAMIDLLLQYGADINIRRFDGARPIDLTDGDYWGWHRDDEGQEEAPKKTALIAGYLLARGADYDLGTAARYGDLGRVKQLLQADPSLAKVPPIYATWGIGAPLGHAASQGREDMVTLLLEYGADPNMREGHIAPRGSALFNAVGGGHFDLAKMLLEHGADPRAGVESSGNVFGGAEGKMKDLLVSYGAGVDPALQGFPAFHTACESGDVDAVRGMLGDHPSLGCDGGFLEEAAVAGQKGVVQVFMDMNPDLWQQVSIHRGDPALLRWMIEQGMDPNQATWKGETPVHRAARSHEPDSLRILLDAGGRTDAIEGFDESTPLGLAARDGCIETVRILLDAGADPNLAGADWARPLAWAQRRGHDDLAILLKAHGAA